MPWLHRVCSPQLRVGRGYGGGRRRIVLRRGGKQFRGRQREVAVSAVRGVPAPWGTGPLHIIIKISPVNPR